MSRGQSAIVSRPEQMQTRMTPKRMRCFVVGCNNKHSGRHLLAASEPLKMQWITFIYEGIAPPDLPKYVYIRDPASPTEVRTRFS